MDSNGVQVLSPASQEWFGAFHGVPRLSDVLDEACSFILVGDGELGPPGTEFHEVGINPFVQGPRGL